MIEWTQTAEPSIGEGEPDFPTTLGAGVSKNVRSLGTHFLGPDGERGGKSARAIDASDLGT
jgi:hypothetical protein